MFCFLAKSLSTNQLGSVLQSPRQTLWLSLLESDRKGQFWKGKFNPETFAARLFRAFTFIFSLDEGRNMTVWLMFQVLLARHKAEEAFYAVKVLQKKAILRKKEVRVTSGGCCSQAWWRIFTLWFAAMLKSEFATECPLFPRRSISCQSGMSCWRMWSTRSWWVSTSHSRPPTNSTLS